MKQNTDSNYNFLLTGSATDTGRVRKANEDSMAAFETANMKVFVVCDGMGGHVGGQVASQTAITAIRDFLSNNITLDPREAIHNSIIAANEAILGRARQQPELAGMGSTCVMLAVTSDGKVYYGHVGDSRIYIIANRKITQLTEDHSVVYQMFKAGIIKNRDEMERHPRKNEITNALGLPQMQPPTVCNAPIEPESGNCFLLCSDGLTGMVGDEQIQRVISKHEIPIQQRAEKLVQLANENGGVDNITVELVEFAIGAPQIDSGNAVKKGNSRKLLLLTLCALIISGGLGWFLWAKVLNRNSADDNSVIDTRIEAAAHPYEFFTKPVEFTPNKEDIWEILQYPDSIEINTNSIETAVDIQIIKIDKSYITVRWGLEPASADTIVITGKTSSEQDFTIKIPLANPAKKPAADVIRTPLPDNATPVKKEVTLDAVIFEFNDKEHVTLDVPIAGEVQWLPIGVKETSDAALVKCDVVYADNKTKKKKIVIEFMKPDYPDNKKITFQVKKNPLEVYTFIIPVIKKTVDEEKPSEEQIEEGEADKGETDGSEANDAPQPEVRVI